MVLEHLFDWALTGLMAVLGILHNNIRSDVRKIQERQETLRDELPRTYQRRDDAEKQFDTVVTMLQRIEDKLDKKVDKK